VSLSWTASVGASGYQIKRSTVSGGPYVVVGCSASTSFVDTGLANGTTYFYVVSATYSGGPVAGGGSANSSQVTGTPQGATPQPPTGVTATAGNAQVSLGWTASSGATSYNVKRSTVTGGPYTTVGSTGGTTFTNTGLTNGTTYFYVVTAQNASGESGSSSEVNATPQAPVPQPPTGVTATPGNAQVSLGWTASSGATSYNVKRSTVTGGPYTTVGTTGGTSFTNTGLTNGTTYFYVVTAVNASGESSNSSQVNATPQAVVPAPPTGVIASANKPGRLSVRWTQSTTPGVAQNGIFRRTSTGTYPASPTATIPANTQYQNDGLTKGTTYCYVVTAISSAGASAPSNESCGSPK
jgi:cellulose 1,4-beta-cellobiosidase